MRNSPDELYPQLCGLLAHFPLFSELAFKQRYCLMEVKHYRGRAPVTKIVGARNSLELNNFITSTCMIRRLKKDVLHQLPEKRRQKVPLEIMNAEAIRTLRADMSKVNPEHFMPGKDLAETDLVMSSLLLKTSRAKLPAIKTHLLAVLEGSNEKAIIFAHHHEIIDEICSMIDNALRNCGLTYIQVDGRTPAVKRPELVKKFQENDTCRFAVLSITACGEGLSFTAAGLVIFAELYWVPGAIEQAEARAHRLGTAHNKVLVEFLVMPNSYDEVVYSRLNKKLIGTSLCLNGVAETLMAGIGTLERKRRGAEGLPAATRDKPKKGRTGHAEKLQE